MGPRIIFLWSWPIYCIPTCIQICTMRGVLPYLVLLSTVGNKNEHYLYFLDPHTSKQRRKSSRMSARGDFTNVVNPSESGDTMDLNSEDDKRY